MRISDWSSDVCSSDLVFEYVQQNAVAQAQIRAPLYEEKVVDFLLEKAEITDRNVTRAELEAAIEEEEGHVHGPGCGHDHDHDHAKPAKKPAEKAKAQKDDEAAPAEAAAKAKPDQKQTAPKKAEGRETAPKTQ